MNDLQTIVRLNEKVKEVVHLSNRIFIVALNAMFQARRAKAMGFNTVTSELRKFSSDIAYSMQGLKRSIEFQIEFIARHQHKHHFSQLVTRIKEETSNPQTQIYVEGMRSSLKCSTDDLYDRFVACYRDFNRAYEKALRSAETGHSLFIHAKVEAQSTGEHIEALLPVVGQIEEAVNTLNALLSEIKNLTAQLSFMSSIQVDRRAA